MTETTAELSHSDRLDGDQRRLLTGICIVIGAISVIPATYNFVLNPMLDGLGASESQQSLLRQLPSIAALLVIFLSGALADRLGARRLLMLCACLFTAGCVLVTAAPVLPVATLGLVVESAAGSAMAVVALAVLSARVTNPKARATAFSTFAIVAPVIYMVMPLIAGLVLDHLSWRLVPALWTLGGLVVLVGVVKFFPDRAPATAADGRDREHAELLTPALAGLLLAAGVQTITSINGNGWLATGTLIRVAVTVVSAICLVVCFRRVRNPSVSLTALRSGGMLILLVVVIVLPFANLWFYMTVGYQYVYGLTAVATAVVMIPAQLAGVVGALVARKLLQTRGITFTGVVMLLALSVTMLSTLAMAVDSPLWLTIAIMFCYAATTVGAGIPLTNSIMDTAPAGEEGSAAAFRGAAAHIGSALGVVVMSTIVYSVIAMSLSTALAGEGLRDSQSAQIAQSMRDGASSEEASSLYAVPAEQTRQIDSAQKSAMIDGLHANGVAGTVLIAAAAAVFWFGRRRQTPAAVKP